MPAVELDLAPVVERLLADPYDYAALREAHAAVGGHPQAYATALRCAAKRAPDPIAAAHWLTEAARVHESVDDLGGAIALLARAWDCDPGNARTRELLAGYLARLSTRVGLALAPVAETRAVEPASPPTDAMAMVSSAPETRADSELRRVAVEAVVRPPLDTLPGIGSDADAPQGSVSGEGRLAGDAAAEDGVRSTAADEQAAESEVPSALTEDTAADSEPPPTLASEPPPVAVLEPPPGSTLKPLVAKAPEEPALDAAIDPDELPTMVAIDFDPSEGPKAPLLDASPPSPSVVDLTDVADVVEDGPITEEGGSSAAFADGGASVAFADERKAVLAAEPIRPTLRTFESTPAPRDEEVSRPGWTESVLDDVYGDPQGPPTDRPSGDRLVGLLFEALHELHFLDDAYDGAEFVLKVVAETTHASVALVHLYDINHREFVVVSAIGTRAEALVDWITPEDDPLVAEVMAGDEATVVLEPEKDPRLCRGRWLLIEPRRSVLCAPAQIDGRYLGLLEVADPTDGSEFTEEDRNALTYVADRLATFLAERGVIFSEPPPPDFPPDRPSVELSSTP